MSYVVWARKWRPMQFADLVGQDHIAVTLGNAIGTDRVAHAFLFTGVRGVGKTSSARILAKALNCLGDPETTTAGTDPGPTATPCLKCAACQQIAAGTDVDVHEIDGASYTGVDEVRKLQDSLPYRPTRDRFKIVIVDEVHMLSQNAWNAFLKTLEEPPPHVKFIFATTEVHKVPVTILSRVQRFDFKLIPTRLILERLRLILREEGIQAEDAALAIIAREAAGSMRDAISLLEQVIAWEAGRLAEADVARILGVASRSVLHQLACKLVGGDASACLGIVDQLSVQGYDIAHVARDVLALLRDLVVARVCDEPGDLLDLADEEQQDVRQLAGDTDADDLVRLHQGFSQGFDDVVRSGQPRAALEMLLVRLARRPALIPIDDLVVRLGALERRLAGGGGQSGPSSASRGRPPATGREPSGGGAGGASPRAREAKTGSRSRRRSPPDDPEAPQGGPPAEDAQKTDPGPREAPSSPRAASPPEAAPSEVPAQPPAPASQRAAAAVLDPPSAATLACWEAVVDDLRDEIPQLAACLEHAAVLQLDGDEVRLAWENGSVFSDQVTAQASRAALDRALQHHLQQSPNLSFQFETSLARGAVTLARRNAEVRARQHQEAVQRVKQLPEVTHAVEILRGRIKEIRIGDE